MADKKEVDVVERHDLVVRGGTIVDGLGGTPFIGDIAVKDGKIREIGTVQGKGEEEIDATGLLITPGFVDVHTHYDGQVTWRSEEHTSELQSLIRSSYAVFCLKKKNYQ